MLGGVFYGCIVFISGNGSKAVASSYPTNLKGEKSCDNVSKTTGSG